MTQLRSNHSQHVLLPASMFPIQCEPQDFQSKKMVMRKINDPCHIILPLIKTSNYKFLISRQDLKALNLNSNTLVWFSYRSIDNVVIVSQVLFLENMAHPTDAHLFSEK